MEEIIKMAFSTITSRVENNEKQLNSLKEAVEELCQKVKEISLDFNDIARRLSDYYELKEKDDLEVYKFGE